MEKHKTALITGASGGIGQALCATFRNNGYRVIALDCLRKEIETDFFIKADLNQFCLDPEYSAKIIARITDCLNTPPTLDVLINNAAIQIIKPMTQISTSDWYQTLNINLVAPFLLTQSLFGSLERVTGSVINIASIHAKLTKPEVICYATSKTALVGLTKSMAVELGSKIRINSICPAAVATPMLLAGFEHDREAYQSLSSMHPVGRIAEPDEVAQTALFLASKDARFINGACLELDGGISSRLHDPI